LSAVTVVSLVLCAIPFVYYGLALYSTRRFFAADRLIQDQPQFPPLSNLKPICGLDPGAYENFASFCRQDYPAAYELVFCIGNSDDPALEVIDRIKAAFPKIEIRVLYGSDATAANDKCAKLARMVKEAKYETIIINDSDVRVQPDYFRRCVSPLLQPDVAGVTCLYASTKETTIADKLQTIGMISDFFPGLFVAQQLDGVKFALGTTIATTRSRIAAFGGYESIMQRPGDDLLVGRALAEQGKVELLDYTIETVPDFSSLRTLYAKRLRWLTVMRHMRPWGHLGLIFTQGIFWSIAALLVSPTWIVALCFLGTYLLMRFGMAVLVGISGMKRTRILSMLWLVPFWDALAFVLWLHSFISNTIRWRQRDYRIQEGILVPVSTPDLPS
jgi:ceramide glucosyltransferase